MNWKSSTLITLLCLFPVFSAVAIGPEHSGSWYWDEQSGHGFSIEIGELPDGSPFGAAYWYTYDNQGNPIFLLGTGVPDGDILDVVFESPVGMIFGEFDPLTVSREDGGTGRFVFDDENIATFQYTPSDFTVANWGHSVISFMPLIKLFGVPISESPELSALESRIEELEGLLADVSRLIDPNTGYDTVRFEGVNVQIVNGSGTTDGETSGTGNLIIGYNELREDMEEPGDCSLDGWYCDYRGGSHMLVIGERNNYTSDSHGGMVVGIHNETSAPFASVSGGANNIASGEAASVLGGNANTASGGASSVSGGGWGTASGEYASVSGGSQNRASGVAASASGGNTNTASGVLATVSGGFGNKASGANSSVSGGDHRTAPGDEDWAAGGLFQDW